MHRLQTWQLESINLHAWLTVSQELACGINREQ
jgi:hypothetical protein